MTQIKSEALVYDRKTGVRWTYSVHGRDATMVEFMDHEMAPCVTCTAIQATDRLVGIATGAIIIGNDSRYPPRAMAAVRRRRWIAAYLAVCALSGLAP